ncbi:hypothetical protein J6590_075687 [Homalodisca vitripennis]|nr:hypothetical protein J6590_075687 [Homalodisca vitripennis]
MNARLCPCPQSGKHPRLGFISGRKLYFTYELSLLICWVLFTRRGPSWLVTLSRCNTVDVSLAKHDFTTLGCGLKRLLYEESNNTMYKRSSCLKVHFDLLNVPLRLGLEPTTSLELVNSPVCDPYHCHSISAERRKGLCPKDSVVIPKTYIPSSPGILSSPQCQSPVTK